jgi:hypothetical protein
MYKTKFREWGLHKYHKSESHDSIKLISETTSDSRTARPQQAFQPVQHGMLSPAAVEEVLTEEKSPYTSLSPTLFDQISDSGYSTGSSGGHFILVSEIASLLLYDEDIQLALAKIADRSQTSEEIVGEIAPFLHYYGQDLSLNSTDAAQLTVSAWVQQYAREIASALVLQFLTEPTWQPALTEEAERQFQTYFRKHIKSAVTSIETGTPHARQNTLLSQSSEQVERLDGITLEDVQEFLNSSEAFERFVSFLTRSIRWDASKAVSDELDTDLQSPLSDSSDYLFHIDWDLESFVREELLPVVLLENYKGNRQRDLEDTLVISGGGEAFSASSFQSYMRWLAPDTTDRLLSLLGVHLFEISGK